MQRFFDVNFALFSLLILSPLLLLVTAILSITGEKEIIFVQKRIGRGGRLFDLYKFATMLKDSPNTGTGTITVKDDPRVLPVGKFLRKTKINELPQLFNVLIGDMSIVGPRPLTDQTFSAYFKDTQEIIKEVRPGLSGIGSVVFRQEEDILFGETESLRFYSDVIAPYKGSLEKWFVNRTSVSMYFSVIVVTIWAVLFPRSTLVWKVFKDLPVPPDSIKKILKYTN